MFHVFDTDRPAILTRNEWKNNIFTTFQEAAAYAKSWLGEYDNPAWDWKVNEKFPYGGYGDFIVIREIETEEKE